jgi:ribonuclease HI
MAAYGRQPLRNLFDDSPTPHIAHPPRTHHRPYYVATDGSFKQPDGGLGVVIETGEGERVDRLAIPDRVPDNNVAEYRALHLGLDVLAARVPADARVGVLVDHDDLAANVNTATLRARQPDWPRRRPSVPEGSGHHWRGIRARISGFEELRAARIESGQNPAHPLANAPGRYHHVNSELPTARPTDAPEEYGEVPPPSRADRHASD